MRRQVRSVSKSNRPQQGANFYQTLFPSDNDVVAQYADRLQLAEGKLKDRESEVRELVSLSGKSRNVSTYFGHIEIKIKYLSLSSMAGKFTAATGSGNPSSAITVLI